MSLTNAHVTTEMERYLAGLWAEILETDRAGVESGFFELGGDSLAISRLCARVREDLAVELSPEAVFEAPTLKLLAAHLDHSPRGESVPPVVPTPREGELPLSFGQERVWFLSHLAPDSVAYHVQYALWLQGPLDPSVLRRALAEVVRRHEILRTTFVLSPSGRPVQRIQPPFEVEVPEVDLRGGADGERQAAERIEDEVRRGFDPGKLPLIRWVLYRLAEEKHVLLLVGHHFLHDGWSVGVLLREIQALYSDFAAGREASLPEPPVQYADFVQWQRNWFRGEVLERQLDYWRGRLGESPPKLELPTDRPRPEAFTLRGDTLRLRVPEELYQALREASRRRGGTLFQTMLAALYALLQRYSGADDLVIGCDMANRRRREVEGMLGMVVNTVVLRTDLGGDPCAEELWERVRHTVAGALVHQDLPFEKLFEALRHDRPLGENPLFQVLFTFHDSPVLDLGDLQGRIKVLDNGTAKADLSLVAVPSRTRHRDGSRTDELELLWEYSLDIFDRSTMERMWGHYRNLLAAMLAEPSPRLSQTPLLSAGEQSQLTAWNATRRCFPAGHTIHALFEEQADRRGEKVAVRYEGESLSYSRLEALSNQVAHHLRSLGVGPETAVALCVERSLEMVAGILGILKAGGAYVPLDPAQPEARMRYILGDVDAPVLLTLEKLQDLVPRNGMEVVRLDSDRDLLRRRPTSRPPPAAGPENLAYVIYTSGSTGHPKGVATSHRNVARLVRETQYADFSPEQVFLQFAPVSFDASTLEIWGPLLNGGELVVFPATPPTLEDLGKVVAESGVTTLWLTAGLFHQMAEEHLEDLRSVRQLLAGGDVLLPGPVRRVLENLPGCTLINGYGPTEGTTFTCCHPMREASEVGTSVSIGRPITNTTVHLLDRLLRQVPVGVYGELFTGGEGVARGYFGQPRLTAERFLPDPFAGDPGQRLYRTGDLSRYLPDGRIEFLGRQDSQVKIRGFRIELREVEVALDGHPQVSQVVVDAPRDDFGDRRLVAWWVPEPGAEPDSEELRKYLRQELPEYMVPSVLMRLAEIPLTANGKVDRRALPVPETRSTRPFVAASSPIAVILASIFTELLGVERIGVHDSFFELGGHSLLAIRILNRIHDELAVDLSLRQFLEAASIARLEEVVFAEQLKLVGPEVVAELLAQL